MGRLTVNLDAVVANWRVLAQLGRGADCAAVVKANAYGLGVAPIAKALNDSGCTAFFVATAAEGVELRGAIGGGASIYVLNGYQAIESDLFGRHALMPVINSCDQLHQWFLKGQPDAYAVMADTGMSRLGMSAEELLGQLKSLRADGRLAPHLLLSHLACADEPAHELNYVQLQRFQTVVAEAKALQPALKCSFASTAGIYLGSSWHFDLLRPGIALYGGSPDPTQPLALNRVVELQLPILQVRTLKETASVGYGAAQTLPAGAVLATVCGGYADGLLRSLSGRTFGYLGGVRVPMVGRVSMDYCVFDISNAIEKLGFNAVNEMGAVEILGEHQSVDELAISSGTLAYEVLTSLGNRYARVYQHSGVAL